MGDVEEGGDGSGGGHEGGGGLADDEGGDIKGGGIGSEGGFGAFFVEFATVDPRVSVFVLAVGGGGGLGREIGKFVEIGVVAVEDDVVRRSLEDGALTCDI